MDAAKCNSLAKRALPCPFCGQRLVAKEDDHGWWIAHDAEPGLCFASVWQIMDDTDLQQWNERAKPARKS